MLFFNQYVKLYIEIHKRGGTKMTKKKDQKTKERLIEITEEQRRIIIQQMENLNKFMLKQI